MAHVAAQRTGVARTCVSRKPRTADGHIPKVAETRASLICTHMNNARTNSAVQSSVSNPAWGDRSSDRLGFDGAGRMIAKRYLGATVSVSGYSATAVLVGFTSAYDHASNKRYERHLHAESRSHLYPGLDSLDRLLQYQRGTLQEAGNGGATVATPITLSATDSDRI